ncbi:MAG: DUF2703 domain-containing protein [Armatimonadetes bacterium]|nr:MAG: DUF2703 domain-containing protein [Armatimonadota bacterium]
MRSLRIVWQRLVDSGGQTCDRCDATHEGLRQAVAKLKEVLRPLDIEITLETREIDRDSFIADPSESNRVWIAGKPIEEWLGARVASSPCCSVCGDSECRTIELGHDVFEAIPSELILKAALIAASELVGPSTRDSRGECTPECCSDRS